MADISKITDANGNTYNLKDTTARGGMVPSGGTAGQVLTQTAQGPAWEDQQGGGTVDTVNGISPDANKNVQTVIELTQAQYNALANPDPNVTYLITDGINNPTNNTINSRGVSYDNTDSGLTATTVQGAIDENATAIETLTNNLTTLTNNLTDVNIASVTRIATTATTGSTGNIALPYSPYSNDGKKYIVAPFALQNSYLRAWVAQSNNSWYLTAVDPNTGATINNTSLDIRYLLITLKTM